MLGRTHLAFAVGTSVPVVVLTGIAPSPGGMCHHLTYSLDGPRVLSLPALSAAVWIALVAAAALGGLLPDIDQPGSLVTRFPANQTRALQRAGAGVFPGAQGAVTRPAFAASAAAGRLAAAVLGGYAGRLDRLFVFLLWLLALLATGEAIVARWLPPAGLLDWPVQWRHVYALTVGTLAALAALVAAGGVSGLVHRLPGHHRGWTHAPPTAIVLGAVCVPLGPVLAPALPGIGAAFALGYISHLVADALTLRGIPLWWPGDSQPSLHLLPPFLRVRTGSGGESLFNLCWPVAVAAAIVVGGR